VRCVIYDSLQENTKITIEYDIGYFVWAFAPFLGPAVSSWISPELSEWAFKLPVILAIYAMLAIILWIGYTMATTPPPIPLEKPLSIERDEVDNLDADKENR
jgi:MFS family permease